MSKILEYYGKIALEAFLRMLIKGPLIIGLFKGFMIFVLPFIVGTIFAENLWTVDGFKEGWYWVAGPLLLVVFMFWSYQALKVNFETVEIIRPNLILDYKEGEQSYQQWDPSPDNPRWSLHRIRVFNQGKKPSKGITVQIDSISPPLTGGVRGLPMKLHVMGRDNRPSINEPSFDLSGETGEFLDVISLGRRDCNVRDLLFPVGSYPQAQPIFILDNDEHEITITVIADGTKYSEKIFFLKKVEDQSEPLRHRFEADQL